jgi:hypothetical protein
VISACALALSAAGSAQAASRLEPATAPASHELPTGGMLLTYTADAAEAPHLSLTQSATDLIVSAPTALGLVVGAPCVQDTLTTAHCPLTSLALRRAPFVLATPTGGVPRPMTLDVAAGVTVAVFAQGTPGQPDVLHGGEGPDILVVGDGGTADGGAGDDHVTGTELQHVGTLIGGEGNDRLEWGADARGGPGNDIIQSSIAADGGPGDDQLIFVQQATGAEGNDTIDGVSYSGPSQVDGGPGADDLSATGAGAVAHGGDGDDRLHECSAVCAAGAVEFFGDAGNDTMVGTSQGATLDGGEGHDAMTLISGFPGAPGNDVRAGTGADTVKAKQGVVDTIDCGDGVDAVGHDLGDHLTACESDLDPAPVPPAAVKPAPPAKLTLRTPQRLRASATGGLRLKVTCAGATACTGRLRLKLGKTTLGEASCKLKGTRTMTLKLTRQGLKLLRRRTSLKARLSFVAAKGTASTPSRSITLLAPRRR